MNRALLAALGLVCVAVALAWGADDYVLLPTTQKLDHKTLTVGANTVLQPVGVSGGVMPSSRLTLQEVTCNPQTATTTTCISSTGGQTINVYGMVLYNGAGNNDITFQDSTGPTILQPLMEMGARSLFGLGLRAEPWYTTGSGESFDIVTSAAVKVSVKIWYTKG